MTKTVYHYLEASYALDDIQNSRLKVSLIGRVNDPLELRAAVLQDFTEAENEQLVTEFTKDMGLMCFSGDRNNATCWERYGGGGHGMCLVFKIDRAKIEEVQYVKELHQIVFPERWMNRWKKEGLTEEIAEVLHPYVMQKYTTKLIDQNRWNDEKEWRAFPKLDHDSRTAAGLYFSDDWNANHMQLKSVILGPSCSASIKDIRTALEKHYRRHPHGEVTIEVRKPS